MLNLCLQGQDQTILELFGYSFLLERIWIETGHWTYLSVILLKHYSTSPMLKLIQIYIHYT